MSLLGTLGDREERGALDVMRDLGTVAVVLGGSSGSATECVGVEVERSTPPSGEESYCPMR